MRILLYATGHGFGHASRDAEVLRALRRRDPDVRIHVRTAVADWFLDHTLADVPHERSRASLDVGILQPNGIQQDVDATREACLALLARRSALITEERALMAAFRPDAVLCDIPAIPFAAATVPAFGMSNFSWDWIYAALPGFEEVRAAFAADYGRCARLLRLPFHGDTSAFPVVEDVPMVARASRLDSDEARRRLGFDSRAVFVVSFGGLGPGGFDWTALAALREYVFVLTPPIAGGAPAAAPENVLYLENDTLAERGLRYEDLVRAADGVVTKPGYGIVSECLANATRVLYTSRGDFAEYPVLVRALHEHGVARFIDHADLFSGRWGTALDALMSQPRRASGLRADGADVVAEHLLDSGLPRASPRG